MRAVDNIVELVGTSSAMLIVETRATLLLNVFEQQSVHVNGRMTIGVLGYPCLYYR